MISRSFPASWLLSRLIALKQGRRCYLPRTTGLEVLVLAVALLGVACGSDPPSSPPPNLNVAGLWAFERVSSGSGAACAWDLALELNQTNQRLFGEQYSAIVTCSILGSVSRERIPAGVVTGEVSEDKVVLIVRLTTDVDRDTLRGVVEGSQMRGATWVANRLFGPPPTGVISIRQAKGKSGDTVTVEATLTAAQGTFRIEGDDAYVQDLTSGIKLFQLLSGTGLRSGDRVRVSGRVTAFHGEVELVGSTPNDAPKLVVLGPAPVYDPSFVVPGLINSRLLEGELVCIESVKPVSVPNASGPYTATFTFAFGSTETFAVRVEAGVASALPPSFWRFDETYAIHGILGSFDGVAQLRPRGTGDVQRLGSC